MKKSLTVLALFSVIFIFACAPTMKGTPVHPGSGTAKLQKTATTSALKKIIKNWNVTCDSSTDCPDDVAEMVAVDVDGKTATLCTATLIAPDIMLTNSHCLDDDSVAAADLCKLTKFVFADKSPSGTETALCKEIISKSDIIPGIFDKPDYMVIRLTHPLGRKPLTISRAGLTQHEILTLQKIDPDTTNGGGTLKSKKCKVLQGTAFLPDSSHDTDSVMVTRDCDVVDGNSGSPLINANGEVAAIAFASVDHDAVSEMMNTLNGNTIEVKQELALMAHVTNLACLDLPSAAPVPAVCATNAAVAAQAKKTDPFIGTRVSPNLDPKANWPAISDAVKVAWPVHKDLIETKLGYHPTLSTDNSSVVFSAFCFNNSSTWLPQYAQGSSTAASTDLKTVVMTWAIGWTLNDDLKAVPKLTEVTAPVINSIEFSPANLKTSNESLVKDLGADSTSIWKTCPKRPASMK